MSSTWVYLTGSGEITHDDLTTLCQQITQQWGTKMIPPLSSAVFLTSAQIVLYFDGEEFDAIVPANYGGTDDGDQLPANIAACVSWHLGVHYRGGHARTYLPGIVGGMLQDVTTFTPDAIAAFATAAVQCHDNIEAIGGIGDGIETVEHGIVSFVHNKEWRVPPVFRRINTAAVDSRVDTQRRRLGRDRVA